MGLSWSFDHTQISESSDTVSLALFSAEISTCCAGASARARASAQLWFYLAKGSSLSFDNFFQFQYLPNYIKKSFKYKNK